jgi:hypothetical protein
MNKWKEVIAAVAPGLATALTGGNLLAGAAVKALADNLLGGSTGDPVADEAKIAGLVSGGLTPELRAKIIDAETMLKSEAMKIGLEEKRIDANLEIATLADVADARKTHGTGDEVIKLAWAVLVTWGALTAATLYGLYSVLAGGIEIKDVGVVATVFTVLGSTVGYISNSAQQVLSYYFGSSRGSNQKTAVMAEAISNAGRKGA